MQSRHDSLVGGAQGVLESKGELLAQCARGAAPVDGTGRPWSLGSSRTVLPVTGRVLVFTPHLAQG